MTIGKVFIVVTIAYAAYEVMNADNKLRETIKQGVTLGFGYAGAIAGRFLVSSLCGPAAPVCAIAMIAASGVAGGTVGAVLFETADEELDEFYKYWSY